MGGVDHTVIVQVKKKKERAKKGELLLFHSVLLDIPGQPRGVFVSEHGYQKGALEVASAADIEAYEIREVNREAPRDPITMTHLSIAKLTQKPDQVAFEWAILAPTITDFQMSLDRSWLAQHPEAWPRAADQKITAIVSLARLLDAAGNERTSTQKLVQDRIREFGQAGRTQLEVEFPDPTYISGIIEGSNKDGDLIGDLKIVKLIATLEVITTTITVPQFSATASTYLFRNAVEDDKRYVLIQERGSDLAAELSVPVRNFQITTSDPRILAVSPKRRDALLDELRALVHSYPDDAAMREQLANGLWRTLDDAKAEGALTRRNALLDELCTLARSYPDDAAVRERLTGALVNTLLGAKAEEDRAHRDALLKELCGLARSYPDDAVVRKRLAMGLFNTLDAAKTEGDLARRDALLDQLRALARNYPDDAAVREQLASGLFNTLNAAKTEGDLARCDALLDELRALARNYPDDATVREQLASGLFSRSPTIR
jgi:hypothetical protein